MRKSILFIFLLGFATVAHAQRNYLRENKVRLGFTLTPSIVSLKPQESGVDRNSSRAGIAFGIMADFPLDRQGHYAIASGLQVSTGGSTLKYEVGKGLDEYKLNPAEYNIKLTYVEIPFALKLKTDATNGVGFWGQFGTYLGVPVRARTNVTTPVVNSDDKKDILRDITPINMGMLIGMGIEYPLGDKLTGVVGLNYQNGFIDVTRNAKWDDHKVNMNSFALKLGVFF